MDIQGDAWQWLRDFLATWRCWLASYEILLREDFNYAACGTSNGVVLSQLSCIHLLFLRRRSAQERHFSLVIRCCTISSSVSGATYFNKSPRRHSKAVLTRMFSVVLPSSFAGFPFVFRCLVRHEPRFTAACFPFEVFVGIQRSTSCSFDLVFSRTGSVFATARRPPFFVHRGCLPRPPRTSQLQHPFFSPHFTVWGDPSTSPMDGSPPYKYSREEGWRRGETSRVVVKPSPGMDNCTRPSFAQPSQGLSDRSRDAKPKGRGETWGQWCNRLCKV